MKCSYHPTVDSQAFCTACSKALCAECSHRIKGKVYCQDCLVRGAEWAATVKDLKIPADSPKRAAVCAIIPGIGAVYNGEYMKAITYFAVFAALTVLGDDVNGVFGFGAFAFLIFTIFDAYRTAEAQARARIEKGTVAAEAGRASERAVAGWGIFLIVLGIVLLLQNYIPFHFLQRAWPLAFILLGGYLVYEALKPRGNDRQIGSAVEKREF